ncbi:MAG: excinuclease ABC subunit C [Desulfobacteraceae bacterium 4572_87]|nr:MAG: excinuclease ABC subunit C [Desulfobacteraceae bacterium 4572_87]
MDPDHVQYPLEPDSLRKVLPHGPGVYRFVDQKGRVIYVGKAKDLRKRVLSYFRSAGNTPTKTARMMKMAEGLAFILTLTEKEAFILENDLIKKFKPRYNIILRDDKQYPCLRLDIREPYPRLGIVRKIKKDGALYFGPFSSSNAVHSTTRVISRVFKLRKCKGLKLKHRDRPCINFQMDRCLAPCTRPVSEKMYGEMVEQVRLFLEGRNTELLGTLKKEMAEAADQLDFERAAAIRDRIYAIQKTVERQHVVSRRMADQDIIGIARKEDLRQLAVMFVRRGHLVGSRHFLFEDVNGASMEVMEAFLKQYYSGQVFIPGAILLSEPVSAGDSIGEWISEMAGKKVVIHFPQRGEKKKLVEIAVANAGNLLAGHQITRKEALLESARSILSLRKTPRTIEGLDISNLQGEYAVGVVVAFKDGEPDRGHYLNYRIKHVDGIDDYGMMAEMMERRIGGPPLPDLFLLDGGKGHLAAVKKVLDRKLDGKLDGTDASFLPEVISLAKPDEGLGEQNDKIYVPGRKNPVRLKPDDPVLFLMMRVRDEAHRRAVTYHRKLRSKGLTRSQLDGISGVGKRKKKSLLKHFKGIDAISKAKVEELCKVPGINRDLALKIVAGLSGGHAEEKCG